MELPDRTSSQWSTDSTLLHVKQPPETPEKKFSAIQRSDLFLWTFWAGTQVGSVELPDRTSSEWSTDSALLQVKQPPETHENFFKAIERSDLYLGTFWAGTRVGSVEFPDRTSSELSTDSTLLHVK